MNSHIEYVRSLARFSPQCGQKGVSMGCSQVTHSSCTATDVGGGVNADCSCRSRSRVRMDVSDIDQKVKKNKYDRAHGSSTVTTRAQPVSSRAQRGTCSPANYRVRSSRSLVATLLGMTAFRLGNWP